MSQTVAPERPAERLVFTDAVVAVASRLRERAAAEDERRREEQRLACVDRQLAAEDLPCAVLELRALAEMSAHRTHLYALRTRALEALMDGYRVMPLVEAAKEADIIITVTGDLNVVDARHFEVMKDGCIVANSGHFNDEINIPALVKMSRGQRRVRQFVEEYELHDGRRVYLLADGRLLNLASAEGHPAAVMDMSFANQALSAEYVAAHHGELEPKVYVVPEAIDAEVARLKLAALGIELEPMTPEQAAYVASWQHGT